MRIKFKNVILAIMLVFTVNIVCLPVMNNIMPTSIVESSEYSTSVTAYADESTRGRLEGYKELLEDPDLMPNFDSASGFFSTCLKLVSYVIAFLGFAFVVIMTLRVPIDLLIVALGWDIADDLNGIQALAFGLSSFHKMELGSEGKNTRGGGRMSFKASKRNGLEIPEDPGQYFRDYWLSIVISFVCGGLLLTGQLFPIIYKALDISSVAIDALVNFDTENVITEGN